MPSRDSQTVILSRQTILLVTAVGVGLLTLCYVLGVQVGKQSAALRHQAARGSGEDLQELPASVEDQLKALASANGPEAEPPKRPAEAPSAPAAPAPAPAPAPGEAAAAPAKPAAAAPAAVPPAPARAKENPKEAPAPPPAKADDGVHWTLQLISTPDQDEAQRMVAKARASGFPAAVIAEKGLFKVRLAQNGPRETMDAVSLKLKNRGFKPFAIRVE